MDAVVAAACIKNHIEDHQGRCVNISSVTRKNHPSNVKNVPR
jgi:hypothetical protein